MIQQLLTPYKGREDLTIDDLVHLAAEVLPQIVARQWRHKVTEVPDARTIRYYIQEGLVDRPGGSAGPAALYGYRHLLQIVAIKALQSEFVPIREIKKAIRSLSVDELEGRLEKWATRRPLEGQARSWAPAWQMMVKEPSAGYAGIPEGEPEQPAGAARRFLLGLRRGGSDPSADRQAAGPQTRQAPASRAQAQPLPPPAAMLATPAEKGAGPELGMGEDAGSSDPIPTGWHRFELFPGIELHVREGTEVPDSPSFFSVLASRLRVILEHLRKASSR